MAVRITNVEKDLATLNKELARFDELFGRLLRGEKNIAALRREVERIQEKREVISTNNLTFSWTGATTTIDWAAGYVRDRDDKVYPVPAGSRAGLTASTDYWAGWNPIHQTMSFEPNLNTLTAIPNILVVARIQTGGGGVNGTAGGGGTDPGGVGRSGNEYLFV